VVVVVVTVAVVMVVVATMVVVVEVVVVVATAVVVIAERRVGRRDVTPDVGKNPPARSQRYRHCIRLAVEIGRGSIPGSIPG